MKRYIFHDADSQNEVGLEVRPDGSIAVYGAYDYILDIAVEDFSTLVYEWQGVRQRLMKQATEEAES